MGGGELGLMFAVYETATGRLVSTGTVVAADEELTARGMSKLEVESADGVWNPETLAFDPAPPTPIRITSVDFIQRFTVQERLTLRAAEKTNPVLNDFMELLRLSGGFDIPSEEVTQGLGFLVSQGLLTPQRAAVIGSP